MTLNEVFQILRKVMSNAHAKRGQANAIDEMRVELIPYNGPETSAIGRRESAKKILGLMLNNLQVRGRPKKFKKGEDDAA